MKKLLISVMMFSLSILVFGCNNDKKIEIDNGTITYNGVDYIPLSNDNFSYNQNAIMSKIGWTYNLYFSKIDVFTFQEDNLKNFIYVEGIPDYLWIKSNFTLPSIFDCQISKIVSWIPNLENMRTIDFSLWSDDSTTILLEQIVDLEDIREGLDANYIYSLSINISDYPYLELVGISVLKSEDTYYLKGLENNSQYYQIKDEYIELFEVGELHFEQ
ncbi:hypothetical protein RJI07_01025 [Mycoplasmatota bacterium WC30]